jgi:hypothetical protein
LLDFFFVAAKSNSSRPRLSAIFSMIIRNPHRAYPFAPVRPPEFCRAWPLPQVPHGHAQSDASGLPKVMGA